MTHLFQYNFVTLFLLINVALYIWVSWTFFYSKNSNGTYPNIMFMTAKANGIFCKFLIDYVRLG
jgi:hypothetical protein